MCPSDSLPRRNRIPSHMARSGKGRTGTLRISAVLIGSLDSRPPVPKAAPHRHLLNVSPGGTNISLPAKAMFIDSHHGGSKADRTSAIPSPGVFVNQHHLSQRKPFQLASNMGLESDVSSSRYPSAPPPPNTTVGQAPLLFLLLVAKQLSRQRNTHASGGGEAAFGI